MTKPTVSGATACCGAAPTTRYCSPVSPGKHYADQLHQPGPDLCRHRIYRHDERLDLSLALRRSALPSLIRSSSPFEPRQSLSSIDTGGVKEISCLKTGKYLLPGRLPVWPKPLVCPEYAFRIMMIRIPPF
jgi:hypothetical protein